MTARIIDGKAIAAELRGRIAAEVARLSSAPALPPCLAVVFVGGDPASEVYVRNKGKAVSESGMRAIDRKLPGSASEADLLALIAELNRDPSVHGILVQLPLPPQIDAHNIISRDRSRQRTSTAFIRSTSAVSLRGLPRSSPCTPLGCVMLAKSVHGSLEGLEAVVIGRSNIVGKPMALLLLAENATVTIAHSQDARSGRGLPPRRRSGRGDRAGGTGPRRLDQAGRDGDRRRHQPHDENGKHHRGRRRVR